MAIVAAVDASPAAGAVVERAIAQARMGEQEVKVVHVFQPPSTVYPIEGMYLSDEEEFERAEHDLVWKQIEDQLATVPITTDNVGLRGYPAAAIVDYAREVDADLIVIGTRGRGGFASLMLGSTSQAVIHDATCDVLVVKTEID